MVLLFGGLGVSGCQQVSASCAAGSSAAFDLSVRGGQEPEPSVQYCALGRCSPRPGAGPIPAQQQQAGDDHPAVVMHLRRGEWRISPRPIGHTPGTARIRLYRGGVLAQTSTVQLRWPHQDPCAASSPPNPHVTVGVVQ